MSNNIERLNYYEREYLRSFDFIAEQNYHLEMRRRLNLALHLWGIVDGLEVLKGELAPGLPEQFYISPGMAIDAYGREIVLFAPYALSEDNLRDNHISLPGTYSVWIAYQRVLSTPPAPGYRVCDLKDQYTRWAESARILISNDVGRDPLTAPKAANTLSDDPIKDPWPVLLGSIDISVVNNRPIISNISTSAGQRVYIGLNAQRIVAPVAGLSTGAPDTVIPITVHADLQEIKNLIVGQDFTIDTTKVKPPPDPIKFPDPTKFPGPEGNVRLENNLFIKGDLYKSVGDEWLGLKEYIQDLIPEVQSKTTILPPIPAPADPSNGTETITLISNVLKKPSKASVLVALSGIKWKSKTDSLAWWNDLVAASGTQIELQVNAGTPTKKAATDNEFEVGLSWSVGPKSNTLNLINVESLSVSYIAVFYP